ncbi:MULTISPECIES: hypothetical protein [Vibrio]|uniref:Lipoprotein n=1 Tax=Vibrio proteolyticus NBRC 13287 TaxID=1219065 RepID=U2ZY41_VIBPR|nr:MULTISPECIES: hypothetical protein [Vibrio]NAW57586.1 hypothetical protein [Vibrio sp. V36_P2S2PM302]NAX23321.1 hypothetical protein [Vibrio sp. V39_P1S14PM300]NAX24889.1 hypothetical protein [Vibrio sp. V38_P2S17PM301]NAX31897.1 hypothetical protein [Vibrio sp. V37_P2S8PM304]GAD66325.1 hypothetical protein VPR01S_03_02350 [Vibrio proteolyticus NBRC 13287]
MSSFKLLGSLILAFILVGCGRVQPVMNVENTPVAYNLQSNQVKNAIIEAASDRGWIVAEVNPGELNATIQVRSHAAEVRIPYSEKYYSILYVSSVNLKAEDGHIHRNYNRWINNLNVDIQRELAKAAAEQQ